MLLRLCWKMPRPLRTRRSSVFCCYVFHLLTTHLPSRFGGSNLHQRDPRSALFEGYTGSGADSNRRNMSASPNRFGGQGGAGGGYGYGYPGSSNGNGNGLAPPSGGYRPATPNKKGQYSDAVLNELESQNDQHIEGILGKVRILKDVRGHFSFHGCNLPCCLHTLCR